MRGVKVDFTEHAARTASFVGMGVGVEADGLGEAEGVGETFCDAFEFFSRYEKRKCEMG